MSFNVVFYTLVVICTLISLNSSLPTNNQWKFLSRFPWNRKTTTPIPAFPKMENGREMFSLDSDEYIDPPETNTGSVEEIPKESASEENPEASVSKRSVHDGFNVQEKLLSRQGSAVEIRHIEYTKLDSTRQKRAVFTDTDKTWPNKIPYQIDSSYPTDLVIKLRNILNFIEQHVCVTFVEEPNFDPNNNEYGLTSYILFSYTSQVCSAPPGRGTASYHGPRTIRTCHNWNTIAHETFHSLGVIHEHQAPSSPRYLTSIAANVKSGMFHNFAPMDASHVQSDAFDPSSLMMYNQMDFSENGLPAITPLRQELYSLNNGVRNNFAAVIFELNQVYKCNEFACSNSSVDCGPGYYAHEHGQCKCVCPDGFNPANNCASLIDSTSSPAWPEAPVILLAAVANTCPPGMSVGLINAPMNVYGYADLIFKNGTNLNIWTCSRPSTATDLSAMPPGQYCLIKPVGVSCGESFTEGSMSIKAKAPVTIYGDVGDVTISAVTDFTVKFCCRTDRGIDYPLELPNADYFRMLPVLTSKCPAIKGMASRSGKSALIVTGSSKTGQPPVLGIYSYATFIYHCLYYPPTYGCSEQVTLDATTRTRTISSPGFDGNAREQNKRCLYSFNVPKDSKITVTFDHFDIDTLDSFGMKRYNQWVKPMILSNDNYQKSYITSKDFLFMEYWSFASASSSKGVQFTVELTLKEEMCYDQATRGAEYRGNKWMSETRETCLPWTEALDCEDFPYKGETLFHLKSQGNKCRNPEGTLEEPWCYTSANGSYCQKRYCDVCNLMSGSDLFDTCASMIATDENFCTDSLQRLACAEACGIFIQPAPPTSSDCAQGWTAYGDRCWQWFSGSKTQKEAEQHCNSQQGTIFRIRDSSDVSMIMDFQRDTTETEAKANLWANGRYLSSKARFVTLGDQQNLPMLNLATSAATHAPDMANLYIRAYGQSEAGRLDTELDSSTLSVICETPRKLTFGPPPTPSNAQPVSPLKAAYLPGDAVTFVCNRDNFEPLEATTVCGSEGWTALASVCSGCPSGYTEHKDRCWKWFSSGKTQQQAQDFCALEGGAIFKIRDEEDLDVIRDFKIHSSHFADEGFDNISSWNTWINAKRSSDGKYYTLDDNTLVTYLPWENAGDPNDANRPCAYMLGEDKSEPAKYSTSYTTSKYRFVCEIPTVECDDNSMDKCHEVLAILPDFCINPDTSDLAHTFCKHSCGHCGSPSAEECPSGWTAYQNRCYKWIGSAKTQDAAETYCNAQGDTGTLFKVNNNIDRQTIRSWLQASTNYGSKWNVWYNGQREAGGGNFKTLDDQTLVTYFDWASGFTDPEAASGTNLYQLGEDKTEKGKTGIASSSSAFRFFCQLTLDMGVEECFASSAFGAHPVAPSIATGDVLEFECDEGLLYDSGSKQHTCLHNGNLLGDSLVCSNVPRAISIAENQVVYRHSSLLLNSAYLFNVPSMTIPQSGVISEWYFYATVPGVVSFIVWRYDPITQTYTKVGHNDINVTHLNYKWSVSVPEADRIQVQAGDFIGLFTTKAKIAAHSCYNKVIQLMVVGKKSGVNLASLDTPMTFDSQCIIASVGATLQT